MKNNLPSLKDPKIIFLSLGGIGFSPWAPGTCGSIAALPLLYFLGGFNIPFFFFIPLLIISTIGASVITNHVQSNLNIHDPSWIVIDELLGMLVTWLFYGQSHWFYLLITFFYFRFFDICKWGPVAYFDKKVKNGWGTILDDIVAGLMAGACLYTTKYFLGDAPF